MRPHIDNNTPIAIAGVAEDGAIVRTNAPFLRMFGAVMQESGKGTLDHYSEMVGTGDRDELGKPFEQALAAESVIKPVDLLLNGDTSLTFERPIAPVGLS